MKKVEKEKLARITLYADELPFWAEYCQIAGVSSSCASMTIYFDENLVEENEEE